MVHGDRSLQRQMDARPQAPTPFTVSLRGLLQSFPDTLLPAELQEANPLASGAWWTALHRRHLPYALVLPTCNEAENIRPMVEHLIRLETVPMCWWSMTFTGWNQRHRRWVGGRNRPCARATGRKRTVLVVRTAPASLGRSSRLRFCLRMDTTSPTTRTTSRASRKAETEDMTSCWARAIARHSCDQLAAEPAVAQHVCGQIHARHHRWFTDPTGGCGCFPASRAAGVDLDRVKANGYSQIELTHILWRTGHRLPRCDHLRPLCRYFKDERKIVAGDLDGLASLDAKRPAPTPAKKEIAHLAKRVPLNPDDAVGQAADSRNVNGDFVNLLKREVVTRHDAGAGE